MSTIGIYNGVVDLEELQSKMNSVVEDYMSDNEDWKSARTNLENLLSQTTAFFYNFIQQGNRLEDNSYWDLFARIVSNLCFNYGVAVFQDLVATRAPGRHFKKAEDAYVTAANTMPNDGSENYIEYLDLIEQNYTHALLRQGIMSKVSLAESIIFTNLNLEKNLMNFYTQIREGKLPI